MIDAIFVCVNYNNSNETIGYINHINSNLKDNDFNILVVDNSEDELEIKKLISFIENSLNKNIFVVKARKNLGYFSGMQFGIDFYVKNIGDLPKIIVICNTDIIIQSKDILQLSLNIFKNKNIAIIAPKITLKKNSKEQNPFLITRPSYKKLIFLKFIYSNQLLNNLHNFLYKKIKRNLKVNTKEKRISNPYIYAPHGSFIIINSIFFEKGGSLNYKGFLFGEEIYLGEQTFKLGMKIKYFSNINIIHTENAVTRFIESSKKRILKLNSINFLIKYLYN